VRTDQDNYFSMYCVCVFFLLSFVGLGDLYAAVCETSFTDDIFVKTAFA